MSTNKLHILHSRPRRHCHALHVTINETTPFPRAINNQALRTIGCVFRDNPLASTQDESLSDKKAGLIDNSLPRTVLRIIGAHLDGIVSTPDLSPVEARILRADIAEAIHYISDNMLNPNFRAVVAYRSESDSHIKASARYGAYYGIKEFSICLVMVAEGEQETGNSRLASELRGLSATIDAARK